MAIPYYPVKISSPLSREKTDKYYAKVKTRGEVGLRTLSRRISRRSTVSAADIVAVLEAFLEIIPETLLDGYIVKLGDLGSFLPTIKSEGTETLDELTARKITQTRMQFRPAKYIKQVMAEARFEKIKKS